MPLRRKLLGFFGGRQKAASRRVAIRQAMLRREAELGGQLFGVIPPNRRREFFCLDRHTWVWHEEWLDVNNERQFRTTRYDVRPTGVLKVQDGFGYQKLSVQEARNLLAAIKLYRSSVLQPLYGYTQTTE